MKKVRIKTVTRADGGVIRAEAHGFAETACGKVRVTYVLDGDECELTAYGDGTVVQNRKGNTGVFIALRAGESSVCRVSFGGGEGEFTALCEKCDFRAGAAGFSLAVVYYRGGKICDEERVELDFTAFYE